MNQQNETFNSLKISVLAILAEGLLFILGCIWIYIRSLEYQFYYSLEAVLISICFTLLLLAFNIFAFEVSKKSVYLNRIFQDFFKTWIKPLCKNLSIQGSLIVAITSGLGEELFFRGALNTEIINQLGTLTGLLIGSFLFAYLHFIKVSFDLIPILILYTFVGLIFSLIYYLSGNLLIPILTHCFYNFSVIIYIKLSES
ncbi:MAG: type II CAAX endopeptidase family protein [Bdellovibrionota bacterium]